MSKRSRMTRSTARRGRPKKAPLPKSLDEAVDYLLGQMAEDAKAMVRHTSEDELVPRFHRDWGMGIRNNLLRGGNGELVASCGGGLPDDVSTAIIRAVWQRLQETAPSQVAAAVKGSVD